MDCLMANAGPLGQDMCLGDGLVGIKSRVLPMHSIELARSGDASGMG